jgi:phage tail sheath protein FI
MPVPVSFPGVYVEEIPSGVHAITGVATSIAVFAGWAPKGPTESAGLVLSWSDYVRQYGGLDARSLLGYSVSQFFLNGGQQAYIVRLAASNALAATVDVGTAPNVVTFTAINKGDWANDYGIAIKQGSGPTRFQVRVVYVAPGTTNEVTVESFENVSIVSPDPQGRFVEDVINAGSNIVTAKVASTATQAPATTPAVSPKLGLGKPGDVLLHNTAAFETALNADGSGGAVGIRLLDRVDLFNLVCVPGESTTSVQSALAAYCEQKRAFLIADSDGNTTNYTTLATGPKIPGKNGAFYFPWVTAPDPLNQNRPRKYPPCGFVAGVYARTDSSRGVWKAPAGTEATLAGVIGPSVVLNDQENGVLNPVAVNCIRNLGVYGTVVWGARTVQGADQATSEWKYVPVRRTALMLEESLSRALKWVVFEPNDEPLWAQIRLNVGAFMQTLFRQGAFQGTTPRQAYFVKCDAETTTETDRNNGVVNILVGFAPLKPAEFVVIQIQQIAGQTV